MSRLTAAAARDLKPGETLRDHVVSGLELRARAAVKSWHYYYRFEGKERRPKLGEFPTILIETAREIAKEYAIKIAKGEDPSEERQARRDAPDVAALVQLYKNSKKYQTRTPRTQEEYERHIRLHILPSLGALKVRDVTTKDIDDALTKITKAGHPVAANRCRDVISALFTLAESNDVKWRDPHTNPAKGAATNPEYLRRRYMGANAKDNFERISDALDALEKEWPARVAALRVMLFAGTRVTELITARRDWLDGNTLYLDKHKTERTGEPRIITLPQQAVAILAAIPDDGSGYLFGRDLERHHVRVVWEKARETAGCPDLRMQDFRRTFASAALSRGVSLDAIGQLFGHGDARTTRRYAWLETEAANVAAQGTADVIANRFAKKS